MFASESFSMGHSVVAVLVTASGTLPPVAPTSSGRATAGKLCGGLVGKAWTLLAGEYWTIATAGKISVRIAIALPQTSPHLCGGGSVFDLPDGTLDSIGMYEIRHWCLLPI
jgi:hypothetical protein